MTALSKTDHFAIARRSLPQAIYLSLRDAILSGTYRPGDPLRQEALAKEYDASRVPVREALNRLEAEGLVLLRPHRGFLVASLDVDEIEEIFDLRMILEEHVGRIATRNRTKEDIAAVRKLLNTLDKMEFDPNVDVVEWTAQNRAFHARMFEASKLRHVCQVVNKYHDMVERYIRVEILMTGDFDRAHVEHRDLFQAFVDGDAERVGKLCSEHCASTAKRLVAAIRARMAEIENLKPATAR